MAELVCPVCGKKLSGPTVLDSHMELRHRDTPEGAGRAKEPWLAAIMNIIPFPIGLGYLYLGRWWMFALAVPMGIFLILWAAAGVVGMVGLEPEWEIVLLFFGPAPVFAMLTAAHAWHLAAASKGERSPNVR